ncbi:T9SS type A sorting domain-containing protein [Neolewinella sp.]|uniref:T9SS type A sorting domain-containing protein n=1 Tax=Neolewinella sp. TaxID=2993543 RepID=UPI003B528AA5
MPRSLPAQFLSLLGLLFFAQLPLALSAQEATSDCFYQLRLEDSGGDGFNGGIVTVTVADRPRTFTLDAMQDDGSRRDFYFPVSNGDSITVGFNAGAFPEEVTLSVLDNNDSLVYSVEGPAQSPALTSFIAQCRSCAPPPQASIELFRVRYNSVSVRFRSVPAAAQPTYVIEYGVGDFDPAAGEGTTVTTQDTSLRINDLQPNTAYTFYVSTRCGATDDTTARRGPFRAMTQLQRDIGVTVLRAPTADACVGGSSDSVTIGITNFGGEAQQFFNVDFTINGAPGGVNRPFDGIYTGVLGVDSTEFFTFDVGADLSEPGIYTFELFTQLENDENPDNDRLTTTVIRRPIIRELPYLADFEQETGFWLPERAGRGPATWERARPRGSLIAAAGSGELAYVTNADGNYSGDERSYLTSPCFDLSGLEEDPFLSFLLNVDTEENFDGLYLEVSTDGGATYRRVEQNASTINWYNNPQQRAWDGEGGFDDGYALVGTRLSGLAGEGDVRMRFVFFSDGDGQREGVAIDNIRLTAQQDVDFAAVGAEFLSFGDCDDAQDTLQFTFTDIGRQRRDSVTVSYRVNGGQTDSLRAPAPTTLGRRQRVQIVTNVDVFPPDPVTVEVWVSSPDDLATYNDTTVLVYQPTQAVPFLVDFEDGRRPRGWQLPADAIVARRPGSPSVALTDNLNGQDTVLEFTTASYGPLESEDVLAFTLNQRDASGNRITDGLQRLTVTARTDCDSAAVELLDVEGDISTSFSIGLGQFVGSAVRFTFRAAYGAGDFFVEFDDFSVSRCADGLDISLTTVPPSTIFADDGAAYLDVSNGVGTLTYQWSTEDTTQSIDSLSMGDYSVTVTDALGCSGTRDFTLDLTPVGVDEAGPLAGLEAFPNPTFGQIALRIALPNFVALSVEVYDSRGRRMQRSELGRAQELATEIDLRAEPAGLYFVRVRAGEAVRTLRVVKE